MYIPRPPLTHALVELNQLRCAETPELDNVVHPYMFVVYYKIDDDALLYAYNNLPDGIRLTENQESLLNQIVSDLSDGGEYTPPLSFWFIAPQCGLYDISHTDDFLKEGASVVIPAGVGRSETDLKTKYTGADACVGCVAVFLESNNYAYDTAAAEVYSASLDFQQQIKVQLLAELWKKLATFGLASAGTAVVPAGKTKANFTLTASANLADFPYDPTTDKPLPVEVEIEARFGGETVSTKFKVNPPYPEVEGEEDIPPKTWDYEDEVPPTTTDQTATMRSAAEPEVASVYVPTLYGGSSSASCYVTLTVPVPAAGTSSDLSNVDDYECGAIVTLELKPDPDYPNAVSFPASVMTEAALAKQVQSEVKKKLEESDAFDNDEFLGCLVLIRTTADLQKGESKASATVTWSESTGSEEGTYSLSYRVIGWSNPSAPFSAQDEPDYFYTPAGYASPDNSFSYYVGGDHHVHQIRYDYASGRWYHANVSFEVYKTLETDTSPDTNPPQASFSPNGFFRPADGTHRILCAVNPTKKQISGKDTYGYSLLELYWNGKWNGRDLSTLKNSSGEYPTNVVGPPAGFVQTSDNTDRLVYLGYYVSSGRTYAGIYHLQRWGDQWIFSNRLPRPEGQSAYRYDNEGMVVNVSNPCGYAYGTKANVFYRDLGGALVRLNWDGASWRATKMFDPVANPGFKASGDPFALVRASDGKHFVFYVGGDCRVHAFISGDGAAWTHYDLSAVSGSTETGKAYPNLYSTLSAYVWLNDDSAHVVYRGASNNLCELYCPGTSATAWRFANLSEKTKAQLWGDPVGWSLPKDKGDKGQHVSYPGPDGHLYHARMLPNASWQACEDVTKAAIK